MINRIGYGSAGGQVIFSQIVVHVPGAAIDIGRFEKSYAETPDLSPSELAAPGSKPRLSRGSVKRTRVDSVAGMAVL